MVLEISAGKLDSLVISASKLNVLKISVAKKCGTENQRPQKYTLKISAHQISATGTDFQCVYFPQWKFQLPCHYLDDGEMTHDKYKRETEYVFCKTWTCMGSLQTKLVRECAYIA